jgi:hypothetical protein
MVGRSDGKESKTEADADSEEDKHPRKPQEKKPEVEVAAIGTAEETPSGSWSLGGLLKVAVGSFLLLVTPRSKSRKRAVDKVDTEGTTKPVTIRFGRRKKAAAESPKQR